MEKPNKKAPRVLSDTQSKQVRLLKVLCGDGRDNKTLQIEQIVEQSGLEDENEVQRYLYILEGQKLVTPFPVGDFTADTWRATPEGMSAWKKISKTVVM